MSGERVHLALIVNIVFVLLSSSFQPKGYKVRLYVLQALNLTPMDIGIGGRPGKSDPYLRISLGKQVRDKSSIPKS